VRSSAKNPVDAAAALELLEGVTDLFVARGKKTVHLDLATTRPSDEELLGLLLGRSGTLRAPTLRRGGTLIVGFNPDVLRETLLR
jgi:arsenate reductase-like glutaredoxin family protein